MKAPKKPRYKKAPKAPKATASQETKKRYEQKLDEVEKYNRKLTSDYKKAVQAYEKDKREWEKLRARSKGPLGKIA